MLLPRRVLLGALGALPMVRLARAAPAHRLTILHINDFHSRHDPVDARALTCATGGACFGSSPRLAAAIREQREAARAEGRIVVLLDAGDQFQGSLFYTAHRGAAELAVQHAIGVDAMTLGNHEFDNGPETLQRYLEAARFPVLAANVDTSAEPLLRGLVKPWAMLERDGLRLAVIGLTTQETRTASSPGPNVVFQDHRPALAAALQAARGAGATLVVALSHLGLPLDLGLAGVAAVIGGHTHTLLSSTEPNAAGPHPTPSPLGPLVVQAGAYGRYLGRLDLDLDATGAILAYGGACRHVGQDLAPDPEVTAIVAAFAAPLDELRRRPVATLDAELSVAGCRVAPCPFGQAVAAALRAATHGDGIGLMNAGGLRTGLPAGPVSLGQVLDAMPFGNTLATVQVTGTDLRDIVQHGLAMTGRGGYAQWAGLRVTNLAIEVERNGTWLPLDPAATYLLATNNFLRNGGDGYTTLRDRGHDAYDNGPTIADLFAEALTR